VDLEKALVSSLIREGKDAYVSLRESGLDAEAFVGDAKTAFEFVREYYASFGSIPSKEVVEGKLGIPLPEVIDAPGFFFEELRRQNLMRSLQEEGQDFAKYLDEGQPVEALEALEKMLSAVRNKNTIAKSKIESIPRLFSDVVDYYDRVKAGERGVQTPWPTVNEETMGFWPEDLALFAARVGIGKTWSAVVMAEFAWRAGHRVLFGTTEISKIRIAMRFASIHFNLSYKQLRKGMLDAFAEQKWKGAVKEILDAQGLYVIGGDFDFKIESYEDAIRECDPALSILDGAYLLKVAGTNRMERAANAFDELKRVCKRTHVPNVVTTQLNREAKANVASSVQVERIAMTDVASWNADLIYGLIQTDDMKRDHRMIFKPLKVREGVGEEFEVMWDLDNMNFSELSKSGGGPDGDDPFGTGVDASSSSTSDVPF
jgi:replicative DNA helicase